MTLESVISFKGTGSNRQGSMELQASLDNDVEDNDDDGLLLPTMMRLLSMLSM